MKNLLKCTVVAALMAAPRMALALNLSELQTEELRKTRVAERVASNNSTCLNLHYVGTATEAVVGITGTDLTAEAPDGVADTTFGTSTGTYQLNAAAYDTVGELCDVIEGLASYECSLLGCIRSDDSMLLRNQASTSGTNDLKSAGGFSVKLDTAAQDVSDGLPTNVYVERIGITPADGKRVILKTCTGNANVIGTLNVYGKLRKYEGVSDGVTRNDTTLVWSAVTADDTDLQIPLDITEDGWLEFAKDAHVVISAGNGTGVQAAANTLGCQWDEK